MEIELSVVNCVFFQGKEKSVNFPVGLMLVADDLQEAMLYRIARSFEAARDWRTSLFKVTI